MKNFLAILGGIFLMVTLASCVTSRPSSYPRGPESQYWYNVAILSKKLSKYNVGVISHDKTVALVLPNQSFFVGSSANFTDKAYKILDLVLSFSSYHRGTVIAVSGYSSKGECSDSFDNALNLERAHRVMKQLWNAKTSANLVYSDGESKGFYGKVFLTNCILIEFVDFYSS
jgi:outer membrane protein OmpA-like peptidoglycan-associated protein